MPHLTIEYSANLDGRADILSLCRELLAAALSTDVFETGAVRVRALRAEHFAIADDHPDNAFVHMDFRMATGRPSELVRRIGDALFAAAEANLAGLFETPHFALTLDIRETPPETNWKRNSMHARLRKG